MTTQRQTWLVDVRCPRCDRPLVGRKGARVRAVRVVPCVGVCPNPVCRTPVMPVRYAGPDGSPMYGFKAVADMA